MNTQTERSFVTRTRALDAQPKGPVRFRFIEHGEATFVEIGVDYERAEVPDRRYYADYCNIIQARSGLSLVFGRLVPGESTLRTKVEISFPETFFARQLWRSSRQFHELLEKEFEGRRLPEIQALQDTATVQAFRANNVFMARMSDDAIMDFYYIAPPDIHFVRTGKRSDVYLEPIIRIAMPTALTLEFLEQCRPHAERLHGVTEEANYEQ